MSTIVRIREPAAGSPSGERPRPLAYLVPAVAPGGAVAARGPALQLAAVLEEFGWRTVVGNGGVWPSRVMADRDVPALNEAQLVVCVLPGADWLPSAELAIAATRRLSRIVLTAADEVLTNPVADVVDGAEVLRYAPRRAGEVLHGFLRAQQLHAGELVAARAAQ
jgi:hypothetical protein